MSIHPRQPVTADQLWHTRGERCELVAGEVRTMSPVGPPHARVTARLAKLLLDHVDPRAAGEVWAGDPGFLIARDPDTVLAPDIAFVRTGRLRAWERGFFPGAPDLAIEVRSPGDTSTELDAKARRWLAAGCATVVIADPADASFTVWRSGHAPRVLGIADLFTDDLLPDLRLRIADVFAR
ncbi:MAG: Uma2 family endonuclease [Planctomycetes bacterium]|nr:Uma2 family endonuclease [Planctomycetota bacterium]